MSVGQLKEQIDVITRASIVLPYEHHEIHSGDSYVVCDVQSVNTTTAYWMITTPDSTKYAHIIFDIRCTGELSIDITEGADRVGTTALTAINRNRASTKTATVVVHRAYTGGTTDGTINILSIRDGATGVASKVVATGGARGENEYMLKPNTKYIIKVTTYASVYVSMCVDWYEHTNLS